MRGLPHIADNYETDLFEARSGDASIPIVAIPIHKPHLPRGRCLVGERALFHLISSLVGTPGAFGIGGSHCGVTSRCSQAALRTSQFCCR